MYLQWDNIMNDHYLLLSFTVNWFRFRVSTWFWIKGYWWYDKKRPTSEDGEDFKKILVSGRNYSWVNLLSSSTWLVCFKEGKQDTLTLTSENAITKIFIKLIRSGKPKRAFKRKSNNKPFTLKFPRAVSYNKMKDKLLDTALC